MVYVANEGGGTVSIINTATNTVVGFPINVDNNPIAFGQFIGKAIPTITWSPTPTTITYGTTLDSNTQLDAVATDLTSGTPGTPVPGIFIYTDEAGNVVTTTTVLSAGMHTLTATFTPTYSTSYASGGTATAQFTVNKATPTLTWTPNPNIITYGTSLSSAQLNAMAKDQNGNPVTGSFAYTDQNNKPITLGEILPVGVYTITATFTSTNPNYASGGKVPTTITVVNPSLTINKVASPIFYTEKGQTITYTYTVTNSGDVAISSITVVDDHISGPITLYNSVADIGCL